MDTVRYRHRHLDVACELKKADLGARVEEWRSLGQRALGAESIPDGARLWLGADAWAAAKDLVRREAACCGFLDFELVDEGKRVRLDVTSQATGGASAVAALLGIESECPCSCC
jgi:hypothetical protein